MSVDQWVSAHLFYHGDLELLLREAVQPLVEDLKSRDAIDLHFFVRYWQGGPHVRLRLLPHGDAAPVRRMVEERAEEFFATHASENPLSAGYYRRIADALSRMEYGTADGTPLRPDNSLLFAPYEPEYERYGGALAMEAAQRHFADSSDLALEACLSGKGKDHRSSQALSMMLLAGALCEQEYGILARAFGDGHPAWRGFADGERERAEHQFESAYHRQRARLQPLAERLLNIAQGGTDEEVPAALSRWIDSVRTLRDRLRELESLGALGEPPQPLESQDPADDLHGWRVVISTCVHMNNNRLGLSLQEEAYLGYLLGRTLVDLAGMKGV